MHPSRGHNLTALAGAQPSGRARAKSPHVLNAPPLEELQAAAAVLATTSDGLMWSDEAGDFMDNLIEAARDLCKAEPP